MPRPGKVTDAIVPQIGQWLEQGLDAREIAEKIGCTYGTLRVRCSHLGISLRRRGNARRQASDGVQRPPLQRQRELREPLEHRIERAPITRLVLKTSNHVPAVSEERIVQRAIAAVLKELQSRDGNCTREDYSTVEAPSIEAPSAEPHVSSYGNVLPQNNPDVSAIARNGTHAGSVEQIVITLRDEVAEQLRARAVTKGVSAAMLASTLLQTVVKDDLYEAVLDERA